MPSRPRIRERRSDTVPSERHLRRGNNYAITELRRVKLRAISPAHVQGLYSSKLESGLSTASVRYQHTVLHRALKQATRWGLVPSNVCDAVDPPKVVTKEITPLTPEQTRTFLKAAKGDRYEAIYVLAVSCGLREGELLGLTRSDADLDTRTLRIERQLQRRRDGGGLHYPDPKHGSKKTIKLPKKVAEALSEHLERQRQEIKKAGSLYVDRGLSISNLTMNLHRPKDSKSV